jgi:hypothetical protein
MENLLLVADNVDDLFHAARHMFPRFLSFLGAAMLFAATVVAVVLNPQATLAILFVLTSASLLDRARRRRLLAE